MVSDRPEAESLAGGVSALCQVRNADAED